MAEVITVVGLVASIVQLIDTTIQVIQYAKDIRDVSQDQAKLALEASNLLSLLMSLRYDLEHKKIEDEEWLTAIRSIGAHNGPLAQFKQAMEELAIKLQPQTGMKQLSRKLLWPLDKKQLDAVIPRIERIKSLIALAYERDNFTLSLAIKADLKDISSSVAEISKAVDSLQTELSRQERDEILSWLSPLAYGSKQSDIFHRYQEGTGKWLLKTDQFVKWQTSAGKILWCPGMPGAGKTTLTSFIISEFERSLIAQSGIGLTYAYCNYKNQNETAINVLGSLLRQLLRTRDKLPTRLMNLYKAHRDKGTRPKMSEVSKCFDEVFVYFSEVFVIVDALDEYDEGDGARDILGHELLRLSCLPNAHVLVTSRWVTNIESLFEGCLKLEIRATEQDISEYLKKRIESSSRLRRRIQGDSQLKDQIVETIVERCKGMFLLAQLHMDSLVTKPNIKSIRDALQTIPRKLDETYDLVMKRIEEQNEDEAGLARQMLSWLTYSVRPLTVTELRHALAAHLDPSNIDDESLVDEETMLSICAGIVTIEEKSSIIRFIHYTTQEYFKRIREERFPRAEHEITEACLAYLHRKDFSSGFCRDLGDLRHRVDSYPLFEYAAKNWGDHARGEVEKSAEEGIVKYLMNDSTLSAATQILHYDSKSYRSRDGMPLQSGVHVASYFALGHILTCLIQKGAHSDAYDSFGQTALHITASKYHRSPCLKILLDEDIDENHKRARAWTMLHISAILGRPSLAQEAIERLNGLAVDADPIAKENHGWTPLHRAAFNGHEEMIEFLLNVGFNIDSKDADGATAMHIVASQCKESVIRLLVRHNANINERNKHGETPFHSAIHCIYRRSVDHEPVLQLLLKLGAEINCMDNSGRTPLYWAALSKCEVAKKWLLDNGARLDLGPHSISLLRCSGITNSLPEAVVFKNMDLSPTTIKETSAPGPEYWYQELRNRAKLHKDCLDIESFEELLELDDDDNCDFSHTMLVSQWQFLREQLIKLKDAWLIRDIRSMLGHADSFCSSCPVTGFSVIEKHGRRIETLRNQIENGTLEGNISIAIQQVNDTFQEIDICVDKVELAVEYIYGFQTNIEYR